MVGRSRSARNWNLGAIRSDVLFGAGLTLLEKQRPLFCWYDFTVLPPVDTSPFAGVFLLVAYGKTPGSRVPSLVSCWPQESSESLSHRQGLEGEIRNHGWKHVLPSKIMWSLFIRLIIFHFLGSILDNVLTLYASRTYKLLASTRMFKIPPRGGI
jgi:hypothetical protein